MNRIAYTFLRWGLGIVFVLFGIGKFRNDIWVDTIRAMGWFTMLGGSDFIIYAIGAVEIITGICLIINYRVKLFSALASLQLMAIIVMLKFGEVRDIGLLGGALALFFSSSWRKEKANNINQDFPTKHHKKEAYT